MWFIIEILSDFRWCMILWTWCLKESNRIKPEPFFSTSQKLGDAGKQTFLGRLENFVLILILLCENYSNESSDELRRGPEISHLCGLTISSKHVKFLSEMRFHARGDWIHAIWAKLNFTAVMYTLHVISWVLFSYKIIKTELCTLWCRSTEMWQKI